jgi:hypothetical protein
MRRINCWPRHTEVQTVLTREKCLAEAEEAEGMARLVSLVRDKAQLMAMAEAWRERAARLAETVASPKPVRRRR